MEQAKIKQFYKEIVDWLAQSEIVSKEGAVHSWVNPSKQGYIYSEIIGYYIKFFSYLYQKTRDKEYLRLAIKSADYLSRNLSASGGVSRDKIDYVFDSAICVSGLIALSRVAELKEEHKTALKRLSSFAYSSLSKKQVAFKEGEAIINPEKWSLSYGSLIIKSCIALYESYEFFGDDKYKKMAESIAKEITKGTFKEEGYFTINSQKDFVYTHPHCYATEGLLFMSAKGFDFGGAVEKSAKWLAQNQNPDGSMFNWYLKDDMGQTELSRQGDATSQAVRIWCCVNKKEYKENINRATDFLRSLKSEKGGLMYNKDFKGESSKDINSWTSIFAAQALWWQLEEPEKEWIV